MSSIVHIGRRSDSIIYVKTIFKFTYFKTTHTHTFGTYIHHYISTYIIYIYLQGFDSPKLALRQMAAFLVDVGVNKLS